MLVTLIIAGIVFVILLKIIKSTIKSALIAAAILILLYTGFGITPQSIFHQATHFAPASSHTTVTK